jgi:hypothetical protein
MGRMKDKWLEDMDNEAIYEEAREEGRVIVIGDYAIWDLNHEQFGMSHRNGEVGVFKKADFEAHLAAFFGLNF